MSIKKVLMAFAMNDCGALVSIEHVDRGAACACFCTGCGEPVVAKQGDVKVWHFSHATGADCAGGGESGLHLAAKQLIATRRKLVVPGYSATAQYVNKETGRVHRGSAVDSEKTLSFDQVHLERPVAGIVPDATCVAVDDQYFVEIAVTHFVDHEKQAVLKQLMHPALEITIRLDLNEYWTWEALEEEVLYSTSNKSWLHYPREVELLEDALAQAEASATAEQVVTEQPIMPTQPQPIREKHSWRGFFVWLTEYEFGIVAWCPYNPEVNEIFKRLGGRWQPKYRNWLLPTWAKGRLLEVLCA